MHLPALQWTDAFHARKLLICLVENVAKWYTIHEVLPVLSSRSVKRTAEINEFTPYVSSL